ncbi:Response regulator SaeR [Pelagimonas phthalicica]|uniref:Response regulator SaeR n=1 Tax=Pelagimonas phthalicica TaxID=1037362 RepID=A0A238JBR5_9RHOB|nr:MULTISPECIES: response regulator [Roseobacteraceae]MBO9464823.1 response regulator [Tropicibacter sp. R15_0]TDS91083.1 response regulator receiver domain-containing protein [Pelagimonas phthalicica]SMX28130.1 Response regulator SaeR [Pelagimonas phthalicica]
MPHLYIADDNLDFSEYLETVATREGWTVSLCANGAELVASLKSGTDPAFALVDINMPEMNGIEVIDEITELNRPLRVRFITGGSDSTLLAAKMIASARSLSVGRSVFKPVSKDNFVKLLVEEAEELSKLADASS